MVAHAGRSANLSRLGNSFPFGASHLLCWPLPLLPHPRWWQRWSMDHATRPCAPKMSTSTSVDSTLRASSSYIEAARDSKFGGGGGGGWRCCPCLLMPAPPHSLHRLRRSPCSQKPHDLQFDRRRPCSQKAPPPHSLQKLRFRPCTQKELYPISFIAAFIPFAFNTDANRSCQSLSEAGATALTSVRAADTGAATAGSRVDRSRFCATRFERASARARPEREGPKRARARAERSDHIQRSGQGERAESG